MLTPSKRKPEWMRKTISFSAQKEMDQLLKSTGIHTICQEAKCPNISECFSKKQATFMILGALCTRACTYCNVDRGRPNEVNKKEIDQVTTAVKQLDLKYVVITSPTRDDLSDGGAEHFYEVTQDILAKCPDTVVELLIPDLKNKMSSIERVVQSGAKVIGHNIETVPSMYKIRKGSSYEKSLDVLRNIKKVDYTIKTKSALMVGFGESEEEMIDTFQDLLDVGCEFLSIGQYLPPSNKYETLIEYVTPEQFARYKTIALKMGFKFVHSSPYSRSSYMAHEYMEGDK